MGWGKWFWSWAMPIAMMSALAAAQAGGSFLLQSLFGAHGLKPHTSPMRWGEHPPRPGLASHKAYRYRRVSTCAPKSNGRIHIRKYCLAWFGFCRENYAKEVRN